MGDMNNILINEQIYLKLITYKLGFSAQASTNEWVVLKNELIDGTVRVSDYLPSKKILIPFSQWIEIGSLKDIQERSLRGEIGVWFSVEDDILKEELQIHVDNVFGISKCPKKFKYIYSNTELVETINKLAFLKTYDKYTYYNLIVCLEYYYKIYYFILLQKYSCKSHYHILQDLRKEILNLLQGMILNIPEYSKLYDGNLNVQLDYNSKKIQAMTFKCLKILSHKCNKANKNITLVYKSPLAFDNSQEKWQLF
jgi:hypothetical protein